MTEDERDYVVETLAQEIDLRTPTVNVTRQVNRLLAREFVEENVEHVEAVVARARGANGDLSPWIVTDALLDALEVHCRDRVRPATWTDRD